MDITEKDLQAVRNLIRMGDRSSGYLEGYDSGVNDILKTLWSDGYKEVVEHLISSIEEHNKTHHPIKIRRDYVTDGKV